MVQQTTGIRSLFVGADRSLAERMRLRRWAQLTQEFPDLEKMRVLDLGGTTVFWERSPVRPASVTVINLNAPGEGLPWVTPIQGDACDAPKLVGDEAFDLVFSNSLIEHLGGHAQRLGFAEVVRSLAPRYAVQTPYRYFPVEPHWVFPGMQFLPLNLRNWLAPRWPLGHTHGWPAAEAEEEVMFTELLSLTEMRTYFPDAHIVWERLAGLRKSMTAFR
jgi:Methyltransferase domain